MDSTCKFFDNDAVYRVNAEKFVDIGLVVDISDFTSSDEEQSDVPGWEPIKKGHVKVAWYPNGAEEVLPENEIHLSDRLLMPGDLVKKVGERKDTQLGYCAYNAIKADVQILGSRKVILGVDSKDLIPMKEFVSGIVFKDSSVGVVDNVKSELTLTFSDGSRCVMSGVDASDVHDISDPRDRLPVYKKYCFYPGQELCVPTHCLEKAKWLNVTKTMIATIRCPYERIHVTVEDVKIASASIRWVCKARRVENAQNLEVEPKKPNTTDEDLKSIKMMNIFKPCAQIGNRNFLTMREEYEVVSLEKWKNRMSDKLNMKSSTITHKKKPNKLENEMEKNNMNNFNDIENMCVDSSDFGNIENEESGKSSISASVASHSSSSFIYNSYVKEGMSALKPGEKLVTETLVTETKVHVVWQDGTVEQNISSTSLYSVDDLDNDEFFSQFFPGDYVTDSRESRPYEYGVVKKVDCNCRTALITWMKTYQAGGDPHPEILSEEEVSVYDIKYHSDFRFRPGSCVIGVDNSEVMYPGFSAGQVVDARPTGKVEVLWGSGKTSLCYPQDVFRIGKYYNFGLFTEGGSFSDEDCSETESEESVVSNEDEIGEEKYDPTKDLEKLSIKQEDKDDRRGISRLKEVFTRNQILLTCNVMRNPILLTCHVMRRLLELYKHCKHYLVQSSRSVDLQQVFLTKGTFSMLESVPDQHIYKHSIFQPVAPSGFFKFVRKEVNILRSSLPDGIIVKGFEDRIDLYSVLIKGPKQTPYEDGLFFFDFQFPADYPKVPPLCHYISYCSDRLNPNLFEDGRVCISLLGTWPGEGTEMWIPETSNLIQVIISIQGLILVAEPYFNEDGYEKQRGTEQGREKSQMYNEKVVLKLVQAMTSLIKNPPEIFKYEIVEHFQNNTSKFVRRLEKWIAISESWNSNYSSSPVSSSVLKEFRPADIFAQDIPLPEFPLLPASKGFYLTLKKSLSDFKEVVSSILPSVANS